MVVRKTRWLSEVYPAEGSQSNDGASEHFALGAYFAEHPERSAAAREVDGCGAVDSKAASFD